MGVDEKSIDTILFTSASSCLIEFKDQKDAEKALGMTADTISNKGNISKLTFQNNFVLLHGATVEELEKNKEQLRCGDLYSNLELMGILHFEALRSNYKDKKTGLIKAYCKEEDSVKKLLEFGLKFNYKKHNVSKCIRRQIETVCYKCAGFNHMAIHCREPDKCYKYRVLKRSPQVRGIS